MVSGFGFRVSGFGVRGQGVGSRDLGFRFVHREDADAERKLERVNPVALRAP